jgi:DNA-binding FrmR family transcriptional regulator
MPLCSEDHSKLIARINRVQGQIGGLKKMVEENRDCMQVLKQIAAARGALNSLGALLLEDHLKGCVATAIQEQDGDQTTEQIEQVMEIFKKFNK